MKALPLIGVFVIGIVATFAFSSLHSDKQQGDSKEFRTEQEIISTADIDQIEQQLMMAQKSGGITPENYDLIVTQLNELEIQGVARERIQPLRVILSQLEVGGRRPQQNAIAFDHATPSPTPPAEIKHESSTSTNKPTSPVPLPPPLPPPPPAPTPPPQIQPVAGCQSNSSPVFSKHITDTSKINYIAPPPTLGAGPSLKAHSYIGTDHARVPVYAPVDMALISGAHYVGGPFALIFKVSCEVELRMGHITEPISEVKSVFPAEPSSSSVDEKIDHEISFKAGDLIAYTTGTSAAGNWDFGVYNSSKPNRYASDSAWNWSKVHTTAVCPFDYFTASLKSAYTSKFNSQILGGNPPHGDSFCN